MLIKNAYHIEPGVYRSVNLATYMVVVTELVTYENTNGNIQERADPEVVYRDLVMPHDKYITFGMKLSEFNQNFIQV